MKTAEQWAGELKLIGSATWYPSKDIQLQAENAAELFTQAMQQARDAALEEAANVAWPAPDDYEPMSSSEKAALNISKSIRALKGK